MSTYLPVSRRLGGLALACALTLALVLASTARAADPLDGDRTTLKPKASTVKALDGLGVAVKPNGKADAKGKRIAFPISGGKLEPGAADGKIRHSGGLTLKSDDAKVALKRFKVELADRAVLNAKLGKDRVEVLKLDTSKAVIARDGFDTVIRKVEGKLTNGAAKALNKAFDVKALERGISLGKVKVDASPETVGLLGAGDTALSLDPGAAQAFASEGISVTPIGPAAARSDGSIGFPITGGRVSPETLAGTIDHSGGLRLSKGSTVVDLLTPEIRIGDNPVLATLVGGSSLDTLALDLGSAQVAVDGRRIFVTNVQGRLTEDAANALNEAFSTNAFTPGLLVGTAAVHAEAG